MKHNIRKQTRLMLWLSALIVVVGISLGAASDPGPAPPPFEKQEDTDTHDAAQTDMPAATEQRGKVHHADEANFAELVPNSDAPVLVAFYADWCGPCRMIAPVLEKLAEETTDARIVKVNVDQNPQLAARYGIHSIPSLLIFEKSRVTGRHVGVVSKAQLQAWLSR